jgi:3-oxoadipate enol-lactonase
MPDEIVQGARLLYDVEGPEDAPVLLLSHALGTNRRLWDAQQAAFTARFRVVRYDTRGHGDSGAPTGEYSVAELGSDVLRILDSVGADRAHVAGVSLGGLTALWLAIHAPARIGKIVVANTAGRIGTREHWQGRIDQVRANGFSDIAAAAPPRWFTQSFCTSHPDVVASYQAMLKACDPSGYNGCCAALRDADERWPARIAASALAIADARPGLSAIRRAASLRAYWAPVSELDAAHYPTSSVRRVHRRDAGFSRLTNGRQDTARRGHGDPLKVLGDAHVDRRSRPRLR